jgi:hypothetical protein
MARKHWDQHPECPGSAAPTFRSCAVHRSYQKGYGHTKPTTIFNGGDPTGLVQHIQWKTWGGTQAIGAGTAECVGPHQDVAEGTQQPARIVLFQLGSCRGRRAYDAIEWYFPQRGQHFNQHQYINACTGTYFPTG